MKNQNQKSLIKKSLRAKLYKKVASDGLISTEQSQAEIKRDIVPKKVDNSILSIEDENNKVNSEIIK